jgi:hypothetical protein
MKGWNMKLFAVGSLAFAATASFAQINAALQSNGGVATQSSNWSSSGGFADRANDGNRDGRYSQGSVSHTNSALNSWWQATFAGPFSIERVQIWNRMENQTRINPFRVQLWSGNTVVWEMTNQTFVDNIADGNTNTLGMLFTVNNVTADRVRVQLEDSNYLHMGEVEAFGTAVPEPGTMVALGVGALALARRRRKSR